MPRKLYKGPEWAPSPFPHIRYRIVGPIEINGMNMYEIWDTRTGEKLKPMHFTLEDARQHVLDLLKGKKTLYYNHGKFVRYYLDNANGKKIEKDTK